MNDTSSTAHEKMISLMMQRSGEERLKMGCSMFDTARELVLASCPKELGDVGRRVFLFQRLYGQEYQADRKARILESLIR